MESVPAVRFRRGRLDDSGTIAAMAVDAGDGAVEFMLDGLVPGASARDLLARAVSDAADTLSYRGAIVAEAASGVIGVAATYPAEDHRITDDMRRTIPGDRLAAVAPFFAARVEGSLFVHALFVAPPWRGRGIGRSLLERAADKAAAEGRERISLAVFSSNLGARRLYERCGFSVVDTMRFAPHPRLPHDAEALLMAKRVRRPVDR